MKGLFKYLLCGITTAGVTASVTYFATKEDIKENEKFKGVFAEREKQRKEVKILEEKMQEKGNKVSELKSCVEEAKVAKDSSSIQNLKGRCLK